MSLIKSSFHLAGISLGGLGIALCAASIIILWIVSARLERATESLFTTMDHSMVVVRQRIVQTRDRVGAAVITTEDIRETLGSWTKRESAERLALRLHAADKTERLVSTLEQADVWLEVSESSAALVKGMLSFSRSAGAPSDSTPVDKLIEEIASLRVQLAEATESAAKIRDRIAETKEERSLQERIEQAVPIALRVAGTLGSIGSRLDKSEERMSLAQNQLTGIGKSAEWWIRFVTIGITLLMIWMAAGQIALCRLSAKGFRGTRDPIGAP